MPALRKRGRNVRRRTDRRRLRPYLQQMNRAGDESFVAGLAVLLDRQVS
jgi:hypothetical protein